MKNDSSFKIKRMAGMALLIAVVVALQMLASFIRFGPFSVALVLVPIVVGASVYGPAAGAVLGGAFGAVVLINCANGADAGGHMLWLANPALTAVLCMVKGVAAGLAAGFTYSALSKKNVYAGILCAAFVCPVVNTGIFIAAMVLFYRETLALWAGGSPLIYYVFIVLTGVNFLLELGVNILLGPGVVRVINAVKRL